MPPFIELRARCRDGTHPAIVWRNDRNRVVQQVVCLGLLPNCFGQQLRKLLRIPLVRKLNQLITMKARVASQQVHDRVRVRRHSRRAVCAMRGDADSGAQFRSTTAGLRADTANREPTSSRTLRSQLSLYHLAQTDGRESHERCFEGPHSARIQRQGRRQCREIDRSVACPCIRSSERQLLAKITLESSRCILFTRIRKRGPQSESDHRCR